MLIGLNGQKLFKKNPAGPEKYTYNLYNSLAKIDHKNKYLVFLDENPPKDEFEEMTGGRPNFEKVVIKKVLSWTQVSLAQKIVSEKIDLYFTPVHTVPFLAKTLNKRIKIVSMVHGLESGSNKEYENKPLQKFLAPLFLKNLGDLSDKIIVPSNYTKEKVTTSLGIKVKDKVRVIYEGVASDFYKQSEKAVKEVRKKYNLADSPYLYFLSTIQPRKNLPNLIKAFSEAVKEHPCLLVVSGKTGWEYQESLNSPKKYGIEAEVRFIGRTPQEDISALMSGASAYVNVSFEEGFGLPVLEAMRCETPLLVSDIPTFKEVAKDFPVYVNPNNSTDIKRGINEILSKGVSKSKISQAKEHAKSLTWEKTAQEVLEVFEELA